MTAKPFFVPGATYMRLAHDTTRPKLFYCHDVATSADTNEPNAIGLETPAGPRTDWQHAVHSTTDFSEWTIADQDVEALDEQPPSAGAPPVVTEWDLGAVEDPHNGDLRLICYTDDGRPAVLKLPRNAASALREELNRVRA
ncbi:hypothetical protein [Kitasatospora aureofaciens]|uniref:hypothetical protein n=1 Tax=Kitasatospora aureofaciens TaxID=1894 RepID=UPI0005275606|nr:hypothetical protein [Kitasatospora aureofaciens]